MHNNKRNPLKIGTIFSLFTLALVSLCSVAQASEVDEPAIQASIQKIEQALGGRVGVSWYDENSSRQWHYRGDEAFPLTSTFKAFACAALLARVDAKQEDLQRQVAIQKQELITYSPVTEKFTGKTLSTADLCAAAVTLSDNTAGNLVLESIGGPAGFTRFMQALGDQKTVLSRWEPDLNEATPGDTRDTTSPNAAVQSLRTLVSGDALSQDSRQTLIGWLRDDQVADQLIRSYLPESWIIGDKTGAGGYGSRAIIAVIWPPQKKPIYLAIYLTQTDASMEKRNQALVDISKLLLTPLLP